MANHRCGQLFAVHSGNSFGLRCAQCSGCLSGAASCDSTQTIQPCLRVAAELGHVWDTAVFIYRWREGFPMLQRSGFANATSRASSNRIGFCVVLYVANHPMAALSRDRLAPSIETSSPAYRGTRAAMSRNDRKKRSLRRV